MAKRKVTEPYRKVLLATWQREQFRALSPIPACGQGLYLYLLSSPASTPLAGLVRGGRAALAEELGWAQHDFDRVFAELEATGQATADWAARLVYLPMAVAANLPTSPQTITSTYRRHVGLLPPCDLLRRALRDIHQQLAAESQGLADLLAREMAHLVTMGEGDGIPPSHATVPPPDPVAVAVAVAGTTEGRDHHEAAQTAQARERPGPTRPALVGPTLPARLPVPRDAWLSLVECWNRACLSVPEWTAVSTNLEPASQRLLLGALRTTPDLDAWDARFARAAASDHLTNRNGKGFVSSLWWLLEHVDRLDAGQYDDRQSRPQRVAALAGGGVPVAARIDRWECHHTTDRCLTQTACELRTAKAVGRGLTRLEDVPARMRDVVADMAPAYAPKAASA